MRHGAPSAAPGAEDTELQMPRADTPRVPLVLPGFGGSPRGSHHLKLMEHVQKAIAGRGGEVEILTVDCH